MSFSDEVIAKKKKNKAMWLYPKVTGLNPCERWGHSASYSNGSLYVFGGDFLLQGCCGGLNFSDLLVLNLNTMSWKILATFGQKPGHRDSHTSTLVGSNTMLVFGGTNGGNKVNDLHVLNLDTMLWSQPKCNGQPPSPRESHSSTLVCEDKLVIFGGSGEGDGNYLNDLHILHLKTMSWTRPEVVGNVPVRRDSHGAVSIGTKVFIYGGDSGDRYHGDIDVFDMDTLTWSRLVVEGCSPGVRAGHVVLNIGTKVYVIGGVGDKHYYNDVWVLDVSTCLWTELDIRGQKPQGRFSHTAIVANSDIVIYGGCGEDERPLNELIILQLGAVHPNGRYNISMCKIFGNHLNKAKRRSQMEPRNSKSGFFAGNSMPRDLEIKSSQLFSPILDTLHPKRRRTNNSKALEIESEQEYSHSLSQNSSQSQSDHEQPQKSMDCINGLEGCSMFIKKRQYNPSQFHFKTAASDQMNDLIRIAPRAHPKQLNPKEALVETVPKSQDADPFVNMIGSEVQGKIDGVFDSGLLMTAMLNGRLFRGVLFAPGPGVVPQIQTQPMPNMNYSFPTSGQKWRESKRDGGMKGGVRSDLEGVILTLGSPGSGGLASGHE